MKYNAQCKQCDSVDNLCVVIYTKSETYRPSEAHILCGSHAAIYISDKNNVVGKAIAISLKTLMGEVP